MTMAANLLLMLDRPTEPLFGSKGSRNSVFNLPNTYLTERYKDIGVLLNTRFGEAADEKISIQTIALPDISFTSDVPRRDQFSLFIPRHSRTAGRLIDLMLGMRNVEDLISLCAYIRDRINPFLFNYALSVTIMHRPDTQGIDLPTFAETFPEKYLDSSVFSNVREECTFVPVENRRPIEIPRDFTASDLEPEHRLFYFREDLGVNLHHWHWHLVYPNAGAPRIVAKDRRGELFFYMHQQIVARYNLERLCNKLNRVERLMDLKATLKEGYFPKLDSLVASRTFPARIDNSKLADLRREMDEIQVDIDDMTRWRDRIFDAIHSGFITNERGQKVELTEMEGIDVLGNIVEASSITPNRSLYGNIHNMGHLIVGYCHDPDHRHLESFGVIGDSATAMRDPVFYRWHAFVDDIFQEFKATIPTYRAELNFANVSVTGADIEVEGGQKNILETFWQKSDVNLSRGMDFLPRGPVFVRFTHLQHKPFTYKIKVNNASKTQLMGTCRIFLGAKNDERGLPMLFQEQKHLFIELDKFPVTLRPGVNEISQKSDQSSVTIPFERTFRDLDRDRPTGGDALAQFNFCGCGWPQHMLIPKGTPEGYPCQLFVMISNSADDRVEQTPGGPCSDAASFCGIKDKLYPDKRSMGFPFDRMPRTGVKTLQEFVTPNMRLTDVSIKFTDRVEIRGA